MHPKVNSQDFGPLSGEMARKKISAAVTTSLGAEEEKTLQDELSLPILLSDRVIKSVLEAESSKPEIAELAKQVDRLSQMLRSVVRLAITTPSLYENPIRRIIADVSKNLERALSLVRKCKHSGVLCQVFAITTIADFRKVSSHLESSVGDMKWLLSIFDCDGVNLSLPPIASNDPILAWVWSSIATIQMGQLKDRVVAANELASIAWDNDRNKMIIVREGGVFPLLKLLKEGSSSEAQIAASNALFKIATDKDRVQLIVDFLGIPIIVHVLNDSSMKVQSYVANLVSRMAELEPVAQEEFARENVTKPLVSLLSVDTVLDDPNLQLGKTKTSIHSLVQINKALAGKTLNNNVTNLSLLPSSYGKNSSSFSYPNMSHRKEKEVESSEVKFKVKISCSEALWRLSKGSLSNSRKITETKGLICLAKIIEKEKGDLQLNCLKTVMGITAVAESNTELRKTAFRTDSLAAKAVLEQLLRVIQEGNSPTLQIPAIRSIGSLARTFSVKETQKIISPLVSQLGNRNMEVAIEAAIALEKFVCSENYNCVENSKAIIGFYGVPSIMKLLQINDRSQMHGSVLLCYFALHVANSKALEQARALAALEGVARSVVGQYPDLRDLFAKAIHHLTLYQAIAHPQTQAV